MLKRCGLFFFTMILCVVCLGPVFGQNQFETELQKKTDSLISSNVAARDVIFPNSVLQSLTAPSGWGGYGTYVFGGIGGSYYQAYSTKPDLISFAGFCFGNPEKFVNMAFSINATDVSGNGNFSGNVSISRQIFKGSSISIGALQLFANSRLTDADGSTFYFAFSHAVQSLPSKNQGSSKLSYTVGIGNGRFYRKSPKDVLAGRGTHGTAIFGGVSYEMLKWMNINLEWSGMNLGFSMGIKPLSGPLAIGIGLTNLTRYSSNRPNLSFVVCYPLSLKR